ncbi:MAG: hypothetical protein HS104_08960 [Polyangiaceae bacterium]|nr:hypothetical protein [Polyangiaceae bacterium]MBK8997583.1 hypothetical protein [Myxococcales bacterium]MCE7893850.1 hypothetical protein [Sorangiineae bacterium PRO1]MCL4751253.1 hypothetical protein [Myxococcales bacterium]
MKRLACLLVLVGCSEDADPRPACLGDLPATCAPLYAPEFDQIYAQTLSKKCATSGGSCHGPAGDKGGLTFADADGSFAELTSEGRIVPGDPACSELVVRLDATGHAWSMPPGKPLSSGERCAIRTWIAQGAER